MGEHDIGNQGIVDESNTIRIGTVEIHTATLIARISGATVPAGVAVYRRFQRSPRHHHILGTFQAKHQQIDKTSEVILALKPVSFRYKKELDPDGIRQFGLVAEEVEKVNPNLVARDNQGKTYSVRYEAADAMLLNDFREADQKVAQQH